MAGPIKKAQYVEEDPDLLQEEVDAQDYIPADATPAPAPPDAPAKPKFDMSKPSQTVAGAGKPKFDPSKPSSTVAGAKSKFDQPEEESKEPMGAMRGAWEGLRSGVSFGAADKLAGIEGAVIDKGKSILPGQEPVDFWDRYDYWKKKSEEALKQASSEHPETYYPADIAGSVVSPANKLFAPVKGANWLKNLAKLGAGGATMAIGSSKEDMTNSDNWTAPAIAGAGINTTLHYGLGGLSNIASKVTGQGVKELAERNAVKAATGNNTPVFEELVNNGTLQQTGNELLTPSAKGLKDAPLKFGATAENTLPRVTSQLKEAGAKIGDVGRYIDNSIAELNLPKAVSGFEIGSRINDYLRSIPEGGGVSPAVIKRLRQQAEGYMKRGDMTFAEAQILKDSYQHKASDTASQYLTRDATNKIKSIVGSEMDNAAERLSQNPNITPEIRDKLSLYGNIKKRYGAMAEMADAGEHRKAANLSGRLPSPSDTFLAGLAGASEYASHADPVKSLLVAGIVGGTNHVLRNRGRSMAAVSLKKVANMMEKSPESLGKFRKVLEDAAQRGETSLALTHQLLSKDPEYNETVGQ